MAKRVPRAGKVAAVPPHGRTRNNPDRITGELSPVTGGRECYRVRSMSRLRIQSWRLLSGIDTLHIPPDFYQIAIFRKTFCVPHCRIIIYVRACVDDWTLLAFPDDANFIVVQEIPP